MAVEDDDSISDVVKEFFDKLDEVENTLNEAISTLDAFDGLTEAGEHAAKAAFASISGLRASELHYYEHHVDSP